MDLKGRGQEAVLLPRQWKVTSGGFLENIIEHRVPTKARKFLSS